MTLARGLFLVQSVLLVVLALGMVTTQKLVRSLALHAVTLFVIGMVYLTAGATFMAAVQVLVYAGSVTILLVFALMMTSVGRGDATALDHQARLRAGMTALGVLALLAYAILASPLGTFLTRPTGVKLVAHTLFTAYVYPFELLSLVLLAALVGVAAVAGRLGEQAAEDGEPESWQSGVDDGAQAGSRRGAA